MTEFFDALALYRLLVHVGGVAIVVAVVAVGVAQALKADRGA
jgi:hypothetical protein